MITIQNKITPALNRATVLELNRKITPPLNCRSILCEDTHQSEQAPVQKKSSSPMPSVREKFTGKHPVIKGQKVDLNVQKEQQIKACFGWNTKDARCDIDVSAFLLTDFGRVPDDSWFVFYGQKISPDRSVFLAVGDRNKVQEYIGIDFRKLNAAIKKIVFVLTIDQAFQKNLNFSMVDDAYIKIEDRRGEELVSFKMKEYYENATSMVIGELYLHNGKWKFNPVGNGIHQDLAGQCAVYGVEIS